MLSDKPFDAAALGLPSSLKATRHGAVAVLTLARSEKRNSLNDAAVIGIETFFTSLPDDIKAAVIAAEGEHFSAGLDLGELKDRDVAQGIERRSHVFSHYVEAVVPPIR